ncbi:MAG: chemotaxis protein CheW, partial [Oscillospiraceae bacterium]
GSVSISSQLGKGMTTIMRIPLTMAIMDGMEVAVGDSIFTIPINNIQSTMKVTSGEVIHDSSSGEIIKCQGSFVPIVRAKDLYQLQNGCTEIEDGVLIWLEAGDHSYCLFVDELLGQQQVVVKQLPAYVNSFNVKNYGINGCTLRSDGSISIILDVASLYTAARGM